VQGARDVGVSPGLAHAKQEPDGDHRTRVPGQSCGGSEQRPPSDDDGQGAPRSDAVAQPSAGNLKQRVSPPERAENPAHRDHRKSKLFLNDGDRRGDIDAIHVSDQVGRDRQPEHHVTGVQANERIEGRTKQIRLDAFTFDLGSGRRNWNMNQLQRC
jgi:hypothetical protein